MCARPLTNSKNETAILHDVCEYLRDAGLFFWRTNNVPALGRGGSFRSLPKYTPRGLPDIFIFCRGRGIALEVKRPGSDIEREKNGRRIRAGKLSPYQAEWAARFAKEGGHFYVVRSLEDAMQVMANFIGAPPLVNHPG